MSAADEIDIARYKAHAYVDKAAAAAAMYADYAAVCLDLRVQQAAAKVRAMITAARGRRGVR